MKKSIITIGSTFAVVLGISISSLINVSALAWVGATGLPEETSTVPTIEEWEDVKYCTMEIKIFYAYKNNDGRVLTTQNEVDTYNKVLDVLNKTITGTSTDYDKKAVIHDFLVSYNATPQVVIPGVATWMIESTPQNGQYYDIDKNPVEPWQYVKLYGSSAVKLKYAYANNDTRCFKTTQDVEVYNKAVQIISSVITPLMSDYEKEKAIHNYLIQNVSYDYSTKFGTAYDAIINGTCVCAGYSDAFKLFMDLLNIKNELAIGFGNGGMHEWNIVKLNGNWYQVDVTWDDCLSSYKYFNITDAQMSKDHTWTTDDSPSCTATEFAYKD